MADAYKSIITPDELASIRIAARFIDDLAKSNVYDARISKEMTAVSADIENVINKITGKKSN